MPIHVVELTNVPQELRLSAAVPPPPPPAKQSSLSDVPEKVSELLVVFSKMLKLHLLDNYLVCNQ